MQEPLAWYQSAYVPRSALSVPLTDAGFVLGATVSEQLRTFGGRIFRLDDHLARLGESLAAIGVPADLAAIRTACNELAAANYPLLEPGDDLGITVLVTPGDYPAAIRAETLVPRVFVYTFRQPLENWAADYERGVRLVTSQVAQVPAASWSPTIKCRSRMHYFLAEREATTREPGSRALLLQADGTVGETAIANILAVHGEGSRLRVVSPPRGTILWGVTLEATRELVQKLGGTFLEQPLSLAELKAADEVWLTSTPYAIVPVAAVDGQSIGKAGSQLAGRAAVYRQMLAAWNELTGIDIAEQAAECARRSR